MVTDFERIKTGFRNLARSFIVTTLVSSTSTVLAADWYVDDGKGNDDTGTGTLELPFKTIRRAINAASADDTIYVQPGVYDEGTTPGLLWQYGGAAGYQATRVVVDKKLNFIGIGRREETVILGDYGDPNLNVYYRTNSVACVLIEKEGSGSTFRNFTFKDGNSHQSAGSDALASGGISLRDPANDNFMVIDCCFENCVGRGGGAMRGGIAIRTIFKDNFTRYVGSAAYRSKVFNCLFLCNAADRGDGNRQDLYDCIAVNCLIVGNGKAGGMISSEDGVAAGFGRYYNTAAYDTSVDCADTFGSGWNCVLQGSLGGETTNVRSLSYTVYTNLCVCPYAGDYRPVKNGLCDGTGDAEYLTFSFIPETERNKDFWGVARSTGASTPIGVLLDPAEVKSGVLRIDSKNLSVEGLTFAKVPAYYQSTNAWPCQVKVMPVGDRASDIIGVTLSGLSSGDQNLAFGTHGEVIQTMPPKVNFAGALMQPVALSEIAAAARLYVDCEAKYDGVANGTQDKPYKTLQEAVAGVSDGVWTEVLVAKGHYTNGVSTASGQKSRLAVTGNKRVVFVAEDGPSQTFIEGAPDTGASAVDGCGAEATRCGYFDATDCTMFGFTFMNGYALGNTSGSFTGNYAGGAVYADARAAFVDCVFTGNAGSVGVARGGRFYNCTVTNNTHYCRGLFNESVTILSGCLIANNATKTGGGTVYSVFFNNVFAINCTICEPNAAAVNTYNVNCLMANCAMKSAGGMGAPNADGSVYGCVGTAGTVAFDLQYNQKADPVFAAERCADYRLFETSPAVGYCTIRPDPYGKVSLDLQLAYLRGDMKDEKMLGADAVANAGCFAAVQERLTGIRVSPDGNDANNGFSDDTPLKTLQAAVDLAGAYGDLASKKVVALPGTYSIGAKAHSGVVLGSNSGIRSRVVIPTGVVLESRDGAATTIILGAEAEVGDETRDNYGRGATAIRCAFLELDAVLRGFTLKDGRTSSYTGGYCDDNLGGAVLGRNTDRCSVEDCIVADNCSPCGGAGSYVGFRRCDISGNVGSKFGAVIRGGSLYDCYVHGNRGYFLCDLYVDIVNCTFDDNSLDGTNRTQFCSNGGRIIANTVIFDVSASLNIALGSTVFSNCLFPKGVAFAYTDLTPTNNINTSYTSDELKAMFTSGHAKESSLPMVDAGCDVGSSEGFDADRTARVKNGTIDIGAYEYDWRGDYTRALGQRNLAVYDVSRTGVVERDGVVTMTNGGVLYANLIGKGDAGYVVRASISGSGVLIIKVNGVEVGRLTSSGAVELAAARPFDTIEYDFLGEGSVALARLSRNNGMCLIVR